MVRDTHSSQKSVVELAIVLVPQPTLFGFVFLTTCSLLWSLIATTGLKWKAVVPVPDGYVRTSSTFGV